jgi:hypothetical protein
MAMYQVSLDAVAWDRVALDGSALFFPSTGRLCGLGQSDHSGWDQRRVVASSDGQDFQIGSTLIVHALPNAFQGFLITAISHASPMHKE